jgi:RNA recognition motif-containing protein
LEGPNDNRGTIDKQSIFIGQLDSEVTKEKLIERFSRHGTIIDCNLIIRHPDPSKMTDPTSSNRNYSFAFIKFGQEQAAAEAVEQEVSTSIFPSTSPTVASPPSKPQGQHCRSLGVLSLCETAFLLLFLPLDQYFGYRWSHSFGKR